MEKKTAILLISLLSAALLFMGALSAWLYTVYESPEELAEREKVRDLTEDLKKAGSEIAVLEAEMELKLTEIQVLEEKIDVLLSDDKASDAYQQILLDKIRALEEEVDKTAARIAELDELLVHYENITTLNFGYQAKKISDLLLYLAESNRPMRIKKTEVIDTETGEVKETLTEEVPARLSFFYKDIVTGYTLSYNAEEVMYSASLIKAPYIYSLLKSVVDFERNKLYFDSEGNALYDEEGTPLFEGSHPNFTDDGQIIYLPGEEKYDLSRIWTFDKEKMMKDGSGKLKDMESGVQLTYLELIEYVLLYSDNIAFAEICSVFGYTDYYKTAKTVGARGYASGFMQLSAEDCGKFMEAIYAFIEEDTAYSTIFKDAMINSNYPVLIPHCVAPAPAAHKYGWDEGAYHDTAIVYDEHPYILVIMTDLDQGGNTVNAYIQNVVRSIHSIHKNFYAKK